MATEPCNVFVAEFDVLDRWGGPPAFYRRLIERHADVHFWYPVTKPTAVELEHVHPVLAPWEPLHADDDRGIWVRPRMRGMAAAMADAVAGRSFDAVDCPSGRPILHELRRAFDARGVSVGRYLLSMHGWDSDALALAWEAETQGAVIEVLRQEDRLAAQAADACYGFSLVCAERLRVRHGRTMELLDPADVLDDPPSGPLLDWDRSPTPPRLGTVGALARYKGPDLVVDLVARVGQERLGRTWFIGSDHGTDRPDETCLTRLTDHARRAGIDIDYRGTPAAWVDDVARERSIVAVLGDETFSLSGAEALRNGIPVVANRETGLARWLADAHPTWPLIAVDLGNLAEAARDVARRLADYDAWRDELHDAIERDPAVRPRTGFMTELYRAPRAQPAPRAVPGSVVAIESVVDAAPAAAVAPVVPAAPVAPTRAVAAALKRRWRHAAAPRVWMHQQHPPQVLRSPPARAPRRRPAGPRPSVAVVIVNRNGAAFLEAAIESVRSQGHEPVELFVQDGASTDGSIALLQRLLTADQWDSQPDRGPFDAMNRGARRVRADVLCFLDSDDLLTPGTLATVVDEFARDAELDVLYGDRYFVDRYGFEIGRAILPPHQPGALRVADFVPHETVFLRRRIFDALRGFDDTARFTARWDLLLRAGELDATIRHIPVLLGCHRVHDQQRHATNSADAIAEAQRLRISWSNGERSVHALRLFLVTHALAHGAHRLRTRRRW